MEIINKPLNRIIFIIMSLFVSANTFAQETKKVDIDINTGGDGGSGFFAMQWAWIVGGAVFILLLVALLRGSSRKGA